MSEWTTIVRSAFDPARVQAYLDCLRIGYLFHSRGRAQTRGLLDQFAIRDTNRRTRSRSGTVGDWRAIPPHTRATAS